LRDKTFQESEKELKVLVAEAGADQQVERKTIMGDLSNEIVRIAKIGGYNLIVMSTHGRTGLSRLLMGSVAERVIRHAPCPVFIIHGNSTS
jgi:nucleotide-binding universal stress UspA family protein